MIVTDSGWGVERIFYTAYGEPEVFPAGDADTILRRAVEDHVVNSKPGHWPD